MKIFCLFLAFCALAFTHWISFMQGRADVMTKTTVEFGAPYYRGPFFGTCQTEVYFNNERGIACATLPR